MSLLNPKDIILAFLCRRVRCLMDTTAYPYTSACVCTHMHQKKKIKKKYIHVPQCLNLKCHLKKCPRGKGLVLVGAQLGDGGTFKRYSLVRGPHRWLCVSEGSREALVPSPVLCSLAFFAGSGFTLHPVLP